MDHYQVLGNLFALFIFIIALKKRVSVDEADTFEERVQILQECSFYVVTGWVLVIIANY